MNILHRVVEHTPQGNVAFHKIRRALFMLAAVNPENWASSQGLRQYFKYFEYSFHGCGLKNENFLHSKALRFYLEGSWILSGLVSVEKG